MSDNSRYASSTYATMFYYFKEPGMLIYSILAGMFYWLLTRYFLFSVKNMYLIDIFFCGRLFFLANSVITMSDFDRIFIWQTFFSILIILTLNAFRSNFGKHRTAWDNCYKTFNIDWYINLNCNDEHNKTNKNWRNQ